jgi:hypothetical protein
MAMAHANERVAITGWSGTGKTTLADTYADGVVHCDDYIGPYGSAGAASLVADLFNDPRYAVFEGVLIPQAIRRWLDKHPGTVQPFQRLIVLTQPRRVQTGRQITQGHLHDRILENVTPNLGRRGVVIELRPDHRGRR